MSAVLPDGLMREALIRLWLEPWHRAHPAWRDDEAWPSWASWLLAHHPHRMGQMYQEWCEAFGQPLEAPPAVWMDGAQPLSSEWQALAGLVLLPEQALYDVLCLCGAVSWFNRPEAGVQWLSQQSSVKDPVHLERLRTAWRLARLLRVSVDGTDAMNIWEVEACASQGVCMLLGASNALWGQAWAKFWPHFRWRLAPKWFRAEGGDRLKPMAVSIDSVEFKRLWEQATVMSTLA